MPSSSLLHIDADAFFASCEQAIHPQYRGKPVITGKERGIVAAASYEAKKLGIKRGVRLSDVKKICPNAIILPSDYETYSLFSKRMFNIMRRFSPVVEEYSIDEAFVDIGGLRRPLNMSYPQIALKIKQSIEKELGITVSVGLSSSKVLCKVGSKWQKPAGFTIISHSDIPDYLKKLPVHKVWGIGPNTAAFLYKCGIYNAFDFTCKPEEWVNHYLTKPHQEIYKELKGEQVYSLNTEEKDDYKSVSKTKTFTPPSGDKNFIFAQLCKNLENAFIKVRRHNLAAGKIIILLRQHDYQGHFKNYGVEAKLNRPTAFPNEALPIVRELFEKLFNPSILYRQTGAVLLNLKEDSAVQMSLFESPLKLENMETLYGCIDKISARYGKHTVFMGASYHAHTQKAHKGARGDKPFGQQLRSKNVYNRKFLGMPMMSSK